MSNFSFDEHDYHKNPINSLKEITDFVRIPIIKRTDRSGLLHLPQFTMHMSLAGKSISKTSSSIKDAERDCCHAFLEILPIKAMMCSSVTHSGMDHQKTFSCSTKVKIEGEFKVVSSDCHKKRIDAVRDLFQMIIILFLSHKTYIPPVLADKKADSNDYFALKTFSLILDQREVTYFTDIVQNWQDNHEENFSNFLKKNSSGLLNCIGYSKKIDTLVSYAPVAFIDETFDSKNEATNKISKSIGMKLSNNTFLSHRGKNVLDLSVSAVIYSCDPEENLEVLLESMSNDKHVCSLAKKIQFDNMMITRLFHEPTDEELVKMMYALFSLIHYVFGDDSYDIVVNIIRS